MNKPYNQFRAMLAITKAGLTSILQNPSAVLFSIAFPLVFIVVFGFIGGGGFSMDIGVEQGTDENHPVFKAIASLPSVKFHRGKSTSELTTDLQKGEMDAVIGIAPAATVGTPAIVRLQTSQASRERGGLFSLILNQIVDKANLNAAQIQPSVAVLQASEVVGRKYRTIDFVLPGQLGFSLLSLGVFGTAFVFVSLRQTLVLKRFFATPIARSYILVGEAISRMTFGLISAVIILTIGHFAFGFTLINGIWTGLAMLGLSALGLLIFMGFGFVVSGLSKDESTVPPLANLFTMPQFLLAGTFFPVNNFPTWLQPVSKILPLTYLNDAMRKVAFEGAGLSDIGTDLAVLAVWSVVVYALAVKFFRWE